jgi:hypothetical protein
MRSNGPFVIFVLGAAAMASGLVACGGGKGGSSTGGSGSTSSSSGHTTSGMTSNSSSGSEMSSSGMSSTSSSGNTSGSSSSGGGTQCATYANAICGQLMTCDPLGLQLAYGDLATCKSVAAKDCNSSMGITGTTGLADPAACATALTANCNSFFETGSHPPLACQSKAGTVADGAACGYDAQCVAGDGCDLSQANFPDPRCMQGQCAAFAATGDPCTQGNDDCDARTGDQCVATFKSGTPPTSDGNTVCQAVTYGANGAACVAGTNKDCQTGFNCVANACAPVLAAGAVCDPTTNNNCDPRVHLTCELVPNSNPAAHKCTAPTVVVAGSQCGVVNNVLQLCAGNLWCNTTVTPSVCAARVAQGNGCVTTNVNQCDFGLYCAKSTDPNPGTCQPPLAAVCQ